MSAEGSVDGSFGKGLIEYSLNLLLAVAGEAEKVKANAFNFPSIIARQSDNLGLGGNWTILTAEVNRNDYLLTRFERLLGLDQHACRGQVDNLAQNFNTSVSDRGLKPGRKSEIRAWRNVEQLRHLLTDEFRGIAEEHHPIDAAAYEISDCIHFFGASQHQNRGFATRRIPLADCIHNLLERSLFDLGTEYYEVERLRLSELNRVFGCRNLDDLELLAIEHRGEILKWNLANPGNQYQCVFLRHPTDTTLTHSHIHYTWNELRMPSRCCSQRSNVLRF